ncbi:hypothetical protein ACX0G9_00335 [Flavitalea flava]
MTAKQRLEGKVSFVMHEKEYVAIEYTAGGKKRTINGKIDEASQLKLKEEKLIKKSHHFREGDEVYFTLSLSARGDKMVAEQIIYRFNNALGNLINRSKTDNTFTGYLKLVDGGYFVKETGSYLFFPVPLSVWEIPPSERTLNEPVQFRLENTGNPEKITASLFKHQYIPEYLTAQRWFADKKVIQATIHKVTPHSLYINLIGEKIQAKMPVPSMHILSTPQPSEAGGQSSVQPVAGDSLKVRITFLSPARIAVEAV